jgi:hypothetical protein
MKNVFVVVRVFNAQRDNIGVYEKEERAAKAIKTEMNLIWENIKSNSNIHNPIFNEDNRSISFKNVPFKDSDFATPHNISWRIEVLPLIEE